LAHLFLSHSTADDGFVRELREALADFGLEVWTDSRQLKGGDRLWSEVAAAIESAVGLVVLVSPDSLQSRWVGRELRHGLEVQAQRGRAAFPVIPLSLNGTKLGVLEDDFTEEPAYIPVSSGAGGATAAIHDILVALGQRLPTDRPPVAQPRPEPVEELILKLSDLHFHEQDGVRRAAGNAQLIYEPATTGQRAVESGRWRLIAPLGPIEAEELRWYLERWPVWPNPVLADRARKVEMNLIAWGQALHALALPTEHTANVLQGWAGVGEGASRRFSVTVDVALVAGASEAETIAAREAATALLALPWELLHNGDSFLFQGARPTRVRRRLPNTRPLPVQVVAPPIRVLLITARPEDESCFYIDHRASSLPLVAATEELGDLLGLTLLHPPTYAALEAELARAQQAGEPYHVVHFDGHGVYDRLVGLGGLCFEDPRDIGKLTGRRHETVFTDRLGPLLTDFRIPLVFLEACQSAQAEEGAESVASELLQRGVTSVVAMSHSVLVETARRFVAAFYTELAKGQRVGQAMLAGQRVLNSDQSRGKRYGIGELTLADWFVPVLYQEKQDPQLFEATPAPQTREDIKALLRARLGSVPPEPVDTGFVGRSRDLLAVERLLRQERWAVLRGQGGEGKTALASELARWLVRSQQVRRAAFVSVELCSHEGAVLDALGRQLVGANYSTAKFESTEQALLPIDRALREQPSLLVIDNMESVLLPPYLDAPELLSKEAKRNLDEILKLAERLLRAGKTRIVFTSREVLPAPFDAEHQRRELHQLHQEDAVALIERALAVADGLAPDGGTLEAKREAIEELAEAVQGHARTLALLGPELRKRGVAATQAALVELMQQLQRRFPDNREKSLFASVELSLQRLSPTNRERVRVLGVFHGGINLGVLSAMTGWGRAEVEGLARELVGTGLATANSYDHFSLNPALCPYLKASLTAEEQTAHGLRWQEAMASYLNFLKQQQHQNTEVAATMTLHEVPNFFALLDQTLAADDPAITITRSTALYTLLQVLGKPQLLEHVGLIRDAAASAVCSGYSHAHFEASRSRIEQLMESGQTREARTEAELLLERSQAAGEQNYAEAGYDLAVSYFLLARVLLTAGGAEQALPLAQEAGRRFEAFGKQCHGAERMASVCLTEQGDCLRRLGRYEAAAAAYEESLRLAEQRGAQRDVAAAKLKLGSVWLEKKRLADALNSFTEALEIFSRLNELGTVANIWHRIGSVHQAADQAEAAEDAYIQSLAIKEQLGNLDGQADTLSLLGILYVDILKRPEEAVRFFKRSAEIHVAIGHQVGAGYQWNNLANTLLMLQKLDEAKLAIQRAIECKEAFGYTAEPWTSWAILAAIETNAGDDKAATESRQKARAQYLAYRRDGGENNYGSGRLAQLVLKSIEAGDPSRAFSQLQQISSDPKAVNMLSFITALQAITTGRRDHSIAEDPCLDYAESVELLLLIEALEDLVAR
jgi:tetratricopeptide (TPR) repeat protein